MFTELEHRVDKEKDTFSWGLWDDCYVSGWGWTHTCPICQSGLWFLLGLSINHHRFPKFLFRLNRRAREAGLSSFNSMHWKNLKKGCNLWGICFGGSGGMLVINLPVCPFTLCSFGWPLGDASVCWWHNSDNDCINKLIYSISLYFSVLLLSIPPEVELHYLKLIWCLVNNCA